MILTDLKTLAQITLYLPLGIFMLTIVALLWRRYNVRWIERFVDWLTVLASLVLLIVSILMMFVGERHASFAVFGIDFRLDSLSIFMILLINVVAFAASWNSIGYLGPALVNEDPRARKPWWRQRVGYHVLINFFHFTMLLVPLSDNLIVIWIAIELTTVGSAFLIVHEDKPSSWDATWKYLIITSTGIVLALLGTVFLANSLPQAEIAQEQSNRLLNWSYLISKDASLNPRFVWFAFLFALVGYGTKAGLAPMHTWLPDGHGEAPSPVSALLSGVLLKASLYAILRFYTLTNAVLKNAAPASAPDWASYSLLLIGLFSLLMATPFILKDNPFKRVLAYHSLEHMGIIVFGLGMGGMIAVSGAILHMLNHAITKALMFLAYGNLLKHYNREGIEIQGALRTMPWSGRLLALGGLALVGTPPFNVFMSELLILWGSVSRLIPGRGPAEPSYSAPVVVAAIALFVISTTLIFFGLVNHLKKLVLGRPAKDIVQEKFSWPTVGPLLFLFVLMFGLGIWIFPPLASLVRNSALIVLNLPG